MRSKKRRTFSAEFRHESAQLVVNQNYSIREAASALESVIYINALVKSAHNLSNGSAGARSIADIVTGFGLPLCRYRAKGVMNRLGLVSTQLPRHRYKKASKTHCSIANTLDRQFTPVNPNQVWCGDVTYIWTGQRWSYLAVVIDLYARKPVGWALSNSPDSQLTAKALTMAYESRGRPEKLLFHSDQGSHYKLALSSGNICGVIILNRAWVVEVIVGAMLRWNVSLEV